MNLARSGLRGLLSARTLAAAVGADVVSYKLLRDMALEAQRIFIAKANIKHEIDMQKDIERHRKTAWSEWSECLNINTNT